MKWIKIILSVLGKIIFEPSKDDKIKKQLRKLDDEIKKTLRKMSYARLYNDKPRFDILFCELQKLQAKRDQLRDLLCK